MIRRTASRSACNAADLARDPRLLIEQKQPRSGHREAPVRAVFLAACGICLLAATSCSPPAPGPHRWRQTRVTYYINREANLLSETTIRLEFEEWSRRTPLTFVYGGRNWAGLHRDGRNTISFVTRWPADLPISKAAYCRCWYDRRGNIVEADIVFNNQIARFTTKMTNVPDSYYLEGVLSHEIGHMIGLGHVDSPTSIMKQDSPMAESWFKGIIDDQTLLAIERLYLQ